MRRKLAILAGLLAGVGSLSAQADPNTIVAQVVIHGDGRRTEFIRDPEDRTLETFTRTADGHLISKQKYKLNAAGEPLLCHIFDAQGALLYRVVYAYDNLGRPIAERTFNRKGRKVRDVVYGYDENGKAKQPVAVNYPDPDTPKTPRAPMAPVLTPDGKIPQSMGPSDGR